MTTDAKDLGETTSTDFKEIFAPILSDTPYLESKPLLDLKEARKIYRHYLDALDRTEEELMMLPQDARDICMSANFGSTNGGESRMLIFGLKPAVLSGVGGKFLADNFSAKIPSIDPETFSSFAILKRVKDPAIDYAELPVQAGDRCQVAFSPDQEARVLEKYKDIFADLGLDLSKGTEENVKTIVADANPVALSLILGYSLPEAIFYNIKDFSDTKDSIEHTKTWGLFEKFLTKDQLGMAREIEGRFKDSSTSYSDFVKSAGIKTYKDEIPQLVKFWKDLGIAGFLELKRAYIGFQPDDFEEGSLDWF